MTLLTTVCHFKNWNTKDIYCQVQSEHLGQIESRSSIFTIPIYNNDKDKRILNTVICQLMGHPTYGTFFKIFMTIEYTNTLNHTQLMGHFSKT